MLKAIIQENLKIYNMQNYSYTNYGRPTKEKAQHETGELRPRKLPGNWVGLPRTGKGHERAAAIRTRTDVAQSTPVGPFKI